MKKLYQRRIIAFMWGKNDIIQKTYGINKYMLPGIEEDIMTWKYDDARRVWRRLKTHILKHNRNGLSPYTCPYCILLLGDNLNNFTDCNKCFYGLVNGVCFDKDIYPKPVYLHLIHEINKYCYFDTKCVLHILNNSFYLKLIHKIEKEIL